jgi:methionyl-tRNA synthetase
MSKSLGNVISPEGLVSRYGVDASRYLLINLGTFGEDMDVSFEKLDVNFNAKLANGLGNLCSRVAKMAEQVGLVVDGEPSTNQDFTKLMNNFELSEALKLTDVEVGQLDKFLTLNTPWKKEGEEKKQILLEASQKIRNIALMLTPFMPDTAEQIKQHFQGQVKAFTNGLFPRLG